MTQVKKPNIGTPPVEYSHEYIARLVSEITRLTEEINTVKRGYFTTVNCSTLPTSSAGLRSGDLWNDAGTVKVV